MPVVGTVAVGPDPIAIAVDEGAERLIVANAGAGTVSVLATASGRLIRTASVGNDPSQIVVDERTRHAFVVNEMSDTVSLLDTRSGTLIRTLDLPIFPNAAAVDPAARIVFVTAYRARDMSVLDTTSGATLRTISLLYHNPIEVAVDARAHRVFVTDDDTNVFVLDEHTGRILHTISVGGNPHSLVVDRRSGQVFYTAFPPGSTARGIIALDATTGAVRHILRMDDNPSALMVDETTGRLFAVTNNGLVNVFDVHTGFRVRTLSVNGTNSGSSPALATDERTGEVFIAPPGNTDPTGRFLGSGRVYTLDGTTGALLCSAPVGVGPTAVAVDATAGRVFVASTDGRVTVLDVSTHTTTGHN